MIKIIVTGANGTIGKILLRELSQWNPVGVTRETHDLTHASSVSTMITNLKPDIVLHCASAGVIANNQVFDSKVLVNNLQIMENLLVHSKKVKYIFNIGSGAEYGVNCNINNVSEEYIYDFLLPTDSYGLSKRLIWQRVQSFSNVTTLRVFGCFDPIEPKYRLLRRFVDHINTGQHFELSSNRKFSWISGQDLAQVIAQKIQEVINGGKLPSTLNVAYRETSDMSLSDFLNRWCTLHHKKPVYTIQSSLGRTYTCNSDLMYNTLTAPLRGLDHCLKDYI